MRTPTAPTTCTDCPAPAIDRPGKPPRCASCAAIAQDIARQHAAVMLKTIRTLKAERKEEEKVA
jgi:hypothetical protein